MSDLPRAADLARGKWTDLLPALGVDSSVLDGRNHPCPRNGEGRDRFRFTNRDGTGSYFCHCDDRSRKGRGGGLSLLMCCRRWTYQEACEEVMKIVGTVEKRTPTQSPKTAASIADRQKKVLVTCGPPEGAVLTYLAARGVTPTEQIRQGRTKYWDTTGKKAVEVGVYDVMVCRLTAPDDTRQALHLTYLDGDKKLDVPHPRKLVGTVAKGSAIRLSPAAEEMGVAEGVETSLAAAKLFDLPVWACYCAGGLEGFVPPPVVKTLFIFADNDPDAGGQIAAFKCKQRMHEIGIKAHVMIPRREGQDWNDVLMESLPEGSNEDSSPIQEKAA